MQAFVPILIDEFNRSRGPLSIRSTFTDGFNRPNGALGANWDSYRYTYDGSYQNDQPPSVYNTACVPPKDPNHLWNQGGGYCIPRAECGTEFYVKARCSGSGSSGNSGGIGALTTDGLRQYIITICNSTVLQLNHDNGDGTGWWCEIVDRSSGFAFNPVGRVWRIEFRNVPEGRSIRVFGDDGLEYPIVGGNVSIASWTSQPGTSGLRYLDSTRSGIIDCNPPAIGKPGMSWKGLIFTDPSTIDDFEFGSFTEWIDLTGPTWLATLAITDQVVSGYGSTYTPVTPAVIKNNPQSLNDCRYGAVRYARKLVADHYIKLRYLYGYDNDLHGVNGDNGVYIRGDAAGLNYYYLAVSGDSNLRFGKVVAGSKTEIQTFVFTTGYLVGKRVELWGEGSKITIRVDGQLLHDIYPSVPVGSGIYDEDAAIAREGYAGILSSTDRYFGRSPYVFDDVEIGEVQNVSTLVIQPASVSSLEVGSSVQLQSISRVTNPDPVDTDVTAQAQWTSSNTSVATVVGGRVTAIAPGHAEITATYSGDSGSAGVDTIDAIQLIIDPDELELMTWSTSQIRLWNDLGDELTYQCQWSSSDPSVASVNAGVVEGVARGLAIITATYLGHSIHSQVTVKDTVIWMDPESLRLQVGSTGQLRLYANDLEVTDSCLWIISNPAVASIDKGLVTGLTQGTASVTASYKSRIVTASIVVEDSVLKIDPANLELNIGKTGQVVVTSDGSDISGLAFWTSSNTSVATVAGGLVLALNPGISSIIANYLGRSVHCNLVVTVPASAKAYEPIRTGRYNELVSGMYVGPGLPNGDEIVLPLKTDEELIRDAIETIVMTRQGERLMEPDFGTLIHDLLFDPLDVIFRNRFEYSVNHALSTYEPRVRFGVSSVEMIDKLFHIKYVFQILKSGKTYEGSMKIDRSRT